MPRYPEGSEHEYLQWVIFQDYLFEIEDVHRLLAASELAYLAGDTSEHDRLQQEYTCACEGVYAKRWRREEILSRLYTDTLLRKEGTTFAEVYERERFVSNKTF